MKTIIDATPDYQAEVGDSNAPSGTTSATYSTVGVSMAAPGCWVSPRTPGRLSAYRSCGAPSSATPGRRRRVSSQNSASSAHMCSSTPSLWPFTRARKTKGLQVLQE